MATPTDRKTKGWYSRGYLPHFDGARLQFITYRTADSMPDEVVVGWGQELAGVSESERRKELESRINRFLDSGIGECALRRPENAKIIEDSLTYHDGERYRLLDWTVMPNHVHVLIESFPDQLLGTILQSWKGFTAKVLNGNLGRTGTFWAREYYDRFVRDENHLTNVRRYIDENAVKAGLANTPEEWPHGSARFRTVPLVEGSLPTGKSALPGVPSEALR